MVGQGARFSGSNNYVMVGALSSAGNGAVAIGYSTFARGQNSIAIGSGAFAVKNSIALGNKAVSYSEHSIAIGNNVRVEKDQEHTVYIGGSEDNVYIPGTLHTTLATSSDIRLKNLGNQYTDGLEALDKLKFYHYTFKNDKANTPHVGVIAQELQKVFPNAVSKSPDGFLQIRWEDMFYAAINAIKELHTKVTTLAENMVNLTEKTDKQQNEIAAQAELINIQQQKIDELTARLEKLEKRKK